MPRKAAQLHVSPAKVQPPLPARKLYTRALAARILSASVSTIKRLEKAKKLTPIKLNAGLVRYPAAQVEALAKSTEGEAV